MSFSSTTASAAAEVEPKDGFLYTAGPALASGAAQAVLFNPIDRALYVRVRFRRQRFLDWRNFERPFQGFFNAAVYRTLVGASYMFWQDSARIYIQRFLPQRFQAETAPQLNSFVIGLFAGSVNGLALNTLQAVKFRMWNTDAKGVTFLRTARLMYQEAGIPIFFRGCMTTMVRDSVFGVVYETTRRATAWTDFFNHYVSRLMQHQWLKKAAVPSSLPATTAHAAEVAMKVDTSCGLCAFVANLIAAIVASMLSSPFNYVRSVVYGTPAGAIPLGYWTLLKSFYMQLFYIFRNGQSFTDLHRMPNLADVEHRTAAKAAASSSTSATANASVGLNGGKTEAATAGSNGVRRSLAAGTGGAAATGYVDRARRSAREWARVHRRHPIAACNWANSRLNIGWGSIRVGVGMAMSQSLFHMAQNFARKRSTT